MNWIQLHFQTNQIQSELCETLLWASGAHSVTLSDAGDQPLLEPTPGTSPLWDDIIVTALFDAEAIEAETFMSDIASKSEVTRYWAEPLAEQVWETTWMTHFHPIQCAQNLWIVPKWLDAPNPNATNILLDPGLAFGTGHHASTQLCLAWLAEQDLTDKLVVDYGCGSGILAVAALLLGARYAYAVDIDPQAVTATQQNAALNGVSDKVWAGLPEAFTKQSIAQADIITANILAKPLMMLAENFSHIGQAGAKIVLAGIIKPQLEDVKAAYTPWFSVTEAHQADEGEWMRLALVRNQDTQT